MSLCTLCGKCLCIHTEKERGQNAREILRSLTPDEEKVLLALPAKHPCLVQLAQQNAHLDLAVPPRFSLNSAFDHDMSGEGWSLKEKKAPVVVRVKFNVELVPFLSEADCVSEEELLAQTNGRKDLGNQFHLEAMLRKASLIPAEYRALCMVAVAPIWLHPTSKNPARPFLYHDGSRWSLRMRWTSTGFYKNFRCVRIYPASV